MNPARWWTIYASATRYAQGGGRGPLVRRPKLPTNAQNVTKRDTMQGHDMTHQSKSRTEGTAAECEFIYLRGSFILRRATRDEDINEHWDVLDSEFGRVDVKAAKRRHRNGVVDFTVWWELMTVNRPPDNKPCIGWGIPNEVERFIAVRIAEGFYLINPSDILEDMRKIYKRGKRGRLPFCLHGRPGRGDLMTILPRGYVKAKATHFVGENN